MSFLGSYFASVGFALFEWRCGFGGCSWAAVSCAVSYFGIIHQLIYNDKHRGSGGSRSHLVGGGWSGTQHPAALVPYCPCCPCLTAALLCCCTAAHASLLHCFCPRCTAALLLPTLHCCNCCPDATYYSCNLFAIVCCCDCCFVMRV